MRARGGTVCDSRGQTFGRWHEIKNWQSPLSKHPGLNSSTSAPRKRKLVPIERDEKPTYLPAAFRLTEDSRNASLRRTVGKRPRGTYVRQQLPPSPSNYRSLGSSRRASCVYARGRESERDRNNNIVLKRSSVHSSTGARKGTTLNSIASYRALRS